VFSHYFHFTNSVTRLRLSSKMRAMSNEQHPKFAQHLPNAVLEITAHGTRQSSTSPGVR
jgi:hypothetical protein